MRARFMSRSQHARGRFLRSRGHPSEQASERFSFFTNFQYSHRLFDARYLHRDICPVGSIVLETIPRELVDRQRERSLSGKLIEIARETAVS